MKEVIFLLRSTKNPYPCWINQKVEEKWSRFFHDGGGSVNELNLINDLTTQLQIMDQSYKILDIMLTTCRHFNVSIEEVLNKKAGSTNCRIARATMVYIIDFKCKHDGSLRISKKNLSRLMNRKNVDFINYCVDKISCMFLSREHETIKNHIETINANLIHPPDSPLR